MVFVFRRLSRIFFLGALFASPGPLALGTVPLLCPLLRLGQRVCVVSVSQGMCLRLGRRGGRLHRPSGRQMLRRKDVQAVISMSVLLPSQKGKNDKVSEFEGFQNLISLNRILMSVKKTILAIRSPLRTMTEVITFPIAPSMKTRCVWEVGNS